MSAGSRPERSTESQRRRPLDDPAENDTSSLTRLRAAHDGEHDEAHVRRARQHDAEAEGGAEGVGAGVAEHAALPQVGRAAGRRRRRRTTATPASSGRHPVATTRTAAATSADLATRPGARSRRLPRLAARATRAASAMRRPSGPVLGAGGHHDDGRGRRRRAASAAPVVSRPRHERAQVPAEAAGLPDAGEVVEQAEQAEPDGGEHHQPAAADGVGVDVGARGRRRP